MPKLHVKAKRFPVLTEFTVTGGSIGFGESTVELQAAARNGRWRALYLDEDAVDDLVDEGDLDDDAPDQVLLVHVDSELPSTRKLRDMREVGEVAIEGAGFTVIDASHGASLQGPAGYDGHLDGVHGAIDGEWGLHIQLAGDGHATIWAGDTEPADLILVEIA